MNTVKQQLIEWLDLEQNSLNEISLEDIELAELIQKNISTTISKTFFQNHSDLIPSPSAIFELNGIPCKSFWVEQTKELVLYVWDDFHSEAILVPHDGWMLREDITIH